MPTRLRNNSLTNGHHTPLYTNGPSKYSNHTKNEASTTVSTPQGHNSAESDPVTTTVHQCGGITASDGTGVSVEYGTSEEDSLVEHLPNDNDDDSNQTEQKRKNFWNRYLEAVDNYLNDMHQMSKVSGGFGSKLILCYWKECINQGCAGIPIFIGFIEFLSFGLLGFC